jgi:hypothetical protein
MAIRTMIAPVTEIALIVVVVQKAKKMCKQHFQYDVVRLLNLHRIWALCELGSQLGVEWDRK